MLKAWRKVKLSILFLYIFVRFHLCFIFPPQNASTMGQSSGVAFWSFQPVIQLGDFRSSLSPQCLSGLWTLGDCNGVPPHINPHSLFFFLQQLGRENLGIPETLDFPHLSFSHSFFNVQPGQLPLKCQGNKLLKKFSAVFVLDIQTCTGWPQ